MATKLKQPITKVADQRETRELSIAQKQQLERLEWIKEKLHNALDFYANVQYCIHQAGKEGLEVNVLVDFTKAINEQYRNVTRQYEDLKYL
jgi:hypothetical protein